MNNQMLSIVVPCLNEQKNIQTFIKNIVELKLKQQIEIIFIDDGSKDQSWQKILEVKNNYKPIKIIGLKLTRNFGKEAALEAGLRRCNGDIIITIDCDLQHPTHLINKMVVLWIDNPDIHIINAKKIKRQKESWLKRILVKIYYFLLDKSTGINIKNHTDFKLIDRKVLESYLRLKEKNKFYRGLTQWIGFNSIDVYFTPTSRKHGEESWSNFDLYSYAKSSILSFSYLPLRLISWIGLITFILSIFLTIDTLIKVMRGNSAEGFPTVILLQLGIGSLILIALGIIAEYLSEIYREVKNRPSFIIEEDSSI